MAAGDRNKDKASLMSELFPDVKPLPQTRQPPHHRRPDAQRRPGPAAERPSSADTVYDTVPVTGDARIRAGDILSYRGNGVQTRLMTQLRRGQLQPEARLDLHGLTRLQAQQQLQGFISSSRQAGKRVVLVIHGQGYRSADNIPVLKQHVDQWLRQHPLVLAFHSAQPAHGGAGALYVLLKSGRQE